MSRTWTAAVILWTIGMIVVLGLLVSCGAVEEEKVPIETGSVAHLFTEHEVALNNGWLMTCITFRQNRGVGISCNWSGMHRP